MHLPRNVQFLASRSRTSKNSFPIRCALRVTSFKTLLTFKRAKKTKQLANLRVSRHSCVYTKCLNNSHNITVTRPGAVTGWQQASATEYCSCHCHTLSSPLLRLYLVQILQSALYAANSVLCFFFFLNKHNNLT